ncbi:unnamed protein product [Arabis nemorensis]|uniref:Uncharacterized protein n=1 Tax=Arabis nemorensis TaxID=586526 RepID=A0A565B1X0_9BRAS|nr:unnamed protein product [Arabis nemorensis]
MAAFRSMSTPPTPLSNSPMSLLLGLLSRLPLYMLCKTIRQLEPMNMEVSCNRCDTHHHTHRTRLSYHHPCQLDNFCISTTSNTNEHRCPTRCFRKGENTPYCCVGRILRLQMPRRTIRR